jgi:transcriptional regulator with XRE-family HTH domain
VSKKSIPLNKNHKIVYTICVDKFSDYLEKKFIEWQHKSGRRRTLNEFAEYLEMKKSLLSMWLSGDRKPGRDKIEKLAELLGPDVYDALELPRPDPRLVFVRKNWDRISQEGKRRISDEAAKYSSSPLDEEQKI